VTSFDDAVNILKSKRLVSENVIKEVSGAFFDAPPATTDEASYITEEDIRNLMKPLAAKLVSMGYNVDVDDYYGFARAEAFKKIPDGSTLRVVVEPSQEEITKRQQADISTKDKYSTVDVSFTHWTTEVTSKLFGLYKSKKQVMKHLPDSEGENIDLGTGMFDIPIEQSVDRIAALVNKAEQRVLRGTEELNEAHKLDSEQILDRMSPYAVKKGMEAELKKEKTYDNTTIDKVKERVARKLKKNPNAYDDQIIANVKKVEKQDKELEATELKKELVDKKNAMRKPKGFKADKANTKASKRENRKGKPKGVKVMQDKGVTGTEKVIKEDVIENLKHWLQENITREYHPGMEVQTPDGHGIVKEVKGGTLTVELDDSDLKDYQFNVINKLMDKEPESQPEIQPSSGDEMTKADRDAAWAKIGTPMGSVKGTDTGIPKSLYSAMTPEEKIAAIIEKLNKMEEGEKKEKIKEMIKSKLNEAGDIVTVTTPQGEKVVSTTKSGEGKEMVNSLKSKGITSAKSTTAS
jgi:hypothetical protein